MRTVPNIIVTGTPGVGKTVHCEQLAQDSGLRHLSINQVAKDRGCYETYDEELRTWIVDEDKVCLLVFFFFLLVNFLFDASPSYSFHFPAPTHSGQPFEASRCD